MFFSALTTIGILSAMPQEGALIEEVISNKEITWIGNRKFVSGELDGQSIVFSLCGIGKCSAAATTALMINQFSIKELLFTGVAGGSLDTEIGDIVIGTDFLQHDLDLSPFFPKFYIYSLDTTVLKSDIYIINYLKEAANNYLLCHENIDFPKAKVHLGRIISGDQFIHTKDQIRQIHESLKNENLDSYKAIEMEGAAVAQVCHELQVPFGIIRTISDKANHDSHVDFPSFIERTAKNYSLGVLKEYFKIRFK